MSKRALLTLAPLLSLLSFATGCGNESPTPTATAVPERSAALTTAAPSASAALSASASAPIPAVSASVPPAISAAPTASASASPASIADAGAPQDAGAKPAKTAAPKASAAPSATVAAAQADAGAPPAEDAGAAPAAAGGPAQDLAKQVDAIFLGKKTYSAKFRQEYTLKVSGQVKNSSGTAFIERPNKISFRYDPPNKNRVVSDGTTLKVYVAEDNQMFESPVQKTEYPGAFAFLMGKGIASSFNFSVNDKVAYPAGTVLLGKPLQPNPAYDTAMFFINKGMLDKSDPGVVERVLIVDAQGNKNRFFFEGATQPATIDPSEFTFTPPPGTNITH